MKRICILGSSGSIGTQTLDIVRMHPEDFSVECLAVCSNTIALQEQVKEFHPKMVCVWEQKTKDELMNHPDFQGVELVSGMDGLVACATMTSVDIVVGAVVGMIGIRPIIEAIQAGKDIALANKETLVTAGHLILPLVQKMGVSLLPVDSEHSAIFQCLQGEQTKKVEKILLTASGGPFRGMTKDQLQKVTVEDALKHPNWSMGRKITIDSSTMVNKGLEVMEAKWLFGVELDQIQVVIQPQSVIHSMVQFIDGAIIAQLGTPDMRLPIQYALLYPTRQKYTGERLDFTKISEITFSTPDFENFPGLRLAYEAGREGGSVPTVYNAANERAVSLFLNQKLGYWQIAECIEKMMDAHTRISNPSLDEILEIEQDVYQMIDLQEWR